MDKLEAYRLLDSVESALGANSARCHQLGNYHEWVVILRDRGGYFLWSEQCWAEYCEQHNILVTQNVTHSGGRSGLGAIDTTEVYALAI